MVVVVFVVQSGSPVAAKNVKCSGMELSLGECEFEPADDACLSHAGDAVVFCGAHGAAPFSDGQLRLISASGAPALPHDAGRLEMYLVQAQARPQCAATVSPVALQLLHAEAWVLPLLLDLVVARQAACAGQWRRMLLTWRVRVQKAVFSNAPWPLRCDSAC